jgi:hypothetical protein
MRDWHQDEGEQKKIERIQRPSEETGNECVALIVVELFEETDCFHAQSPNCHVGPSREISQ